MKVLAIDGNSIINRAYYGIRLLSNKQGVYTNAITGFLNIYLKLIKKYQPDCIVAAFDLRAPTFRHKMYSDYKGTRKGMPEELAMQLPYVKDILVALGVHVIEQEGWEADDILGTIADIWDSNAQPCIIATGDRDSFQLVSDNVTVNLAANKEDVVYNPEKINEVYGVTPKQMIEIKALMGDASDNIPGVAGIGEKTALQLIQKYHDVDYIYDNFDSLEITAGLRKKLENGKDSCFLSRQLGTISTEAPISRDMNDYRAKEVDSEHLSAILTGLEMFSLLKKLELKPSATPIAATANTTTEAPVIVERFLNENNTDIFFDNNTFFYYRKNNDSSGVFEAEKAAEFFEGCEKINTLNAKDLYAWSIKNNIELPKIEFDATLAAYLLNANSKGYDFETLCAEYAVCFDENDKAKSLNALNNALYTKICAENSLRVLEEIELPLAMVLSHMESDGITLDIDGITKFGDALNSDIENIRKNIYILAGQEFNIQSPKQLGEILFEKLSLPNGRKTKTGYSTDVDVLNYLADKHPIVKLILEYRTKTKLYSTYVQGLLKVVSNDGRIHTTFKQTETRTGRISSAEPNIQNIPVRTPLGRNMRKFFTAPKEYVLVDADYSQIELRILAHISNDKIMQQAFINGDDIHTITASQVFNQPLDWVTPEMRTNAKAVNFGIVYGIGAFSLSKDINVSVSEADRYIKAYLEKYCGVNHYMNECIENAKKNGYVETMFGRRRYIPEISASNKNTQALGKRIAMNTPIQGTAADIIKLAMVKVFMRLKKDIPSAKLVLQVHDELIVECREEFAQQAAQILKEEMENCVKLNVPLTADVEIGKTWFDAH